MAWAVPKGDRLDDASSVHGVGRVGSGFTSTKLSPNIALFVLACFDSGAKARLSRCVVVGCPAHNESEELSLAMLGELLKPCCHLDIVSTRSLPGDVIAQVERCNASLVFISVLPPGGYLQVPEADA